MKFVSFRTRAGIDSVGVLESETTLVDLGSLVKNTGSAGLSPIRALLVATGGRLAFTADELAGLDRVDLDQVNYAPIVPDPTKIIAAPVNYRDHQAEMMEDYHIDSLGVFLKAPSSVIGHEDTITLPYTDRRFDTFTPVGPYLVTPDEVGDLATLQLRTRVDGALRQDADIKDLIWGVPELISYASSVMTLNPGDIITTGTPAGIGQITDGNTISVDLDRIGILTVDVTSVGAVACPTKGATRGPKPPEEITQVRDRTAVASSTSW